MSACDTLLDECQVLPSWPGPYQARLDARGSMLAGRECVLILDKARLEKLHNPANHRIAAGRAEGLFDFPDLNY